MDDILLIFALELLAAALTSAVVMVCIYWGHKQTGGRKHGKKDH